MKGKIGFVLGAALGYVLGSRAGRERYEQIKRGAQAVWETPLVQQGVSAVKHQIGDGLDSVKAAAANVAKAAFDAATGPRGGAAQPRDTKPSESGAKHDSSAPGDTKSDGPEETLV